MKVLLTESIHESGIRLLTEKGLDVQIAQEPSGSTLAKEIKDAVALLVRMAAVPEAVIAAGSSLRIIARHGVGYEKIDVAAATRRKIPVSITWHANALSVAEHVVALMLAWAKRIVPYDLAVRRHEWSIRNSYSAMDMDGKTLGIVGFGRIGSLVCQKAKAAFNMNILVYDPLQQETVIEKAGGQAVTDIRQVLAAADFISLHAPLTPQTAAMIGEKELEMMKPSCFLINTSRGPVVEEKALFRALKSGVIAGAGLDVFDPEPPPSDNPLFTLPNVILSPHSAALTAECVMRMAIQSAQAIVDMLEGRIPDGVINPEVFTEVKS